MQTIGLIGGMSWASSLEYYRLINEDVQARLGGLHSAHCILYSFDFAEVQRLEHAGEREELGRLLIDAARKLEGAGAGCIVICANTQHRSAEDVERCIDIPLIHIGDAAGEEIRRLGLAKVGLLGTKFTMEEDFYRSRLEGKFGVEVSVPDEEGRDTVHRIIYEELCRGVMAGPSEEAVKAVIGALVAEGAEGVILGCTELPLLVKEGAVDVPLINTTAVHARAAVDFALRSA